MIRNVVMPQLGMGMTSGTIVEWMIAEGARVTRDQALVSIETEKVVTEVAAAHDGVLHIIAAVGTALGVDGLMAQIADSPQEYCAVTATGVSTPQEVTAADAVRLPAASDAPTPTFEAGRRRLRASGLARKIAGDQGIDLQRVRGSGPVGRIVKRDLLPLLRAAPAAAAAMPQVSATAAQTTPKAAADADSTIRIKARIPFAGMRRAIAEKMVKSVREAAQTFFFFEVDVSRLVAARRVILDHKEEIGTGISLTAMYVRALSLACREVPICNSALIADEIVIWDEVNVGIGVALPGSSEYDSGLMVPVVRQADTKGLRQIDQEIRGLVERARAGKLTARDVGDATVTLSSTERLNAGGWTVGTALLSLPQAVAFSPGKPVRKPVVAADGQIVAGEILPCCITFDHRVLDGEPAARLARKLNNLLGNPELMLL